MKRFVLSLSLVLIVSGCNSFSNPKVTEEEAKSIVMNDHSKHIGTVEIISVSHRGHKYIVKWENKDNCENGTDYVDDQSGKIKNGITSIC
ncbi:hypothetical protein [Falsibacillus pallidus]|uniref:hypothetical protein n=1 Tax=Falsibacillus pallidus TaxID=493781 RepID=UPI003D971D54